MNAQTGVVPLAPIYRAEPSRSRPGLGLGLSLVKAIAAAHDGAVTVDSAPGRGSTFTLSLPLVRNVD